MPCLRFTDQATGAHSDEDAAEGGTGGNLGSDEEGSDKRREGEEVQINHECAHAACQGRPFCIIKELEVAIVSEPMQSIMVIYQCNLSW
jgi:hypothetical protein